MLSTSVQLRGFDASLPLTETTRQVNWETAVGTDIEELSDHILATNSYYARVTWLAVGTSAGKTMASYGKKAQDVCDKMLNGDALQLYLEAGACICLREARRAGYGRWHYF